MLLPMLVSAEVALAQPEGTEAVGLLDPSKESGPSSGEAVPVRPPRLVLAEPERAAPITEARLRAHLEVRAAALRAGDASGAELSLGLLEEARDRLGASNAVVPAAVLLEEAHRARDAGDVELAVERVARALRLAPDLLAAHWLHVNVLVELDPTRVARIIYAILEMGRAWTRGFRNQVHLLTLVLAAGLLGMVMAIGAFAGVLLARHLRFLAHDLSQGLPKVIGGGEMSLILLLLAVLPGTLGLGWPASAALALGMTLAYQTSTERVIAGLSIGLVSAAPWIAGGSAPLLAYHGSRVDHLSRVLEEALSQPSEAVLKTHLRHHPQDGLTALVLGVRSARRGDLSIARTLLEQAAESWPQDPMVLNNLGVVQYALGSHEAAEALFRTAARAGSLAAPHLNLSLIASDRADFETADRALRVARGIDSVLTERVAAKAGLPAETRMVLVEVPGGRLWRELYALDREEVSATRAQLWRWVGGRVQEWSVPAWGLLALALGLLGFRTREPTGPCSSCGAPALRDAPNGHCPQCQTVFAASQAVAPTARATKTREVRRHQWRKRWGAVLAALIPGLGSLLIGRTLTGFAQLTLFCMVVALVLLRGLLSLHAWHVPGDGSGRGIVIAAALVVGLSLSLFSVRRALLR